MACTEADFDRASKLVSLGSFAEAAPLLEALVESDGSEGDYRALYGWAAFSASPGDQSAQALALDQLRKAIDLDPASPLGPYYLGRIYSQTGQPNTARKFFRMALDRSPGYSDAEQELRRLPTA